MAKQKKGRLLLRQLRVKLGNLSQEEMAKALGVSRSMYAAIENGKRYGTLKFWRKLQETFNVPKDEVFEMMTEIDF